MKQKAVLCILGLTLFMMACESPSEKGRQPKKQNMDTNQKINEISNTFTSNKADFVYVELESNLFIAQVAYASDSNFTKQSLYPCVKCILRPEVAKALLEAQKEALRNSFRIVIFDCYRPFSVQKRMYEIVNNPNYVAKPTKGSMHNKGCAVDIGLADKNGNLLDMGSAFDEFSEKAHFSYPKLSETQSKNRIFLRKLMESQGFTPYEKEWWHFNFNSVTYPTCDSMWKCE